MDTTTFLRIERTNRLGRLGEQLAEERLVDAGFKDVRNLNRGMNFPYADILARKGSQLFLIGVKSRNEFQANGAINPTYNAILIRNDKKQLLERLGKTEAEITAILDWMSWP
jgi:Holliday junction resolvase-like predicted endonuclease